MAELYCEKLKETLDKDLHLFTYRKPPKYLTCFGINDQDVILFQKLEKVGLHDRMLKQERLNSPSSDSSLDITGHPLECPFAESSFMDDSVFQKVEIKTEDDFHVPLSLDMSREILGTINICLQPNIPIWILTDPKDLDQTVVLGSHYYSGWCCQSVGKVNTTDDIETMINTHQNKAMLPNSKIKSKVKALFSVFDPNLTITSNECDHLMLEVTWNKPTFEVPLNDSNTTLIVKTVVGRKDCITTRLWQQVLLIKLYLDKIMQLRGEDVERPYARNTMSVPSSKDVFHNYERNTNNFNHKVSELLQASKGLSVMKGFLQQKTVIDKTIINVVEEVAAGQRPWQDFTDTLWHLLIDAVTYKELESGLQQVFQKARDKSFKFYIKQNNKTRLAQALLKSNTDVNIVLFFEPLELIVELGIETLKQDYLYIFKQLPFVDKSLEELMMPQLPSFSETSSEMWETLANTWLKWFAQIHTVLDIVCLSVKNLGPSSQTLKSVYNAVLKKYVGGKSPISSVDDLKESPQHEIRAAVLTSDVSSHIVGCQPHQWLLDLNSTSEFRIVSSSHLATKCLPFPDSIKDMLSEKEIFLENTVFFDETFKRDNSTFYHASLLRVADKFF
uniref:Protein zwilch n=1 Tax=Clastoptera arizonana TaxID=38151 RepID=A0A1B6CFF2_9HEMI